VKDKDDEKKDKDKSEKKDKGDEKKDKDKSDKKDKDKSDKKDKDKGDEKKDIKTSAKRSVSCMGLEQPLVASACSCHGVFPFSLGSRSKLYGCFLYRESKNSIRDFRRSTVKDEYPLCKYIFNNGIYKK
jgi:hypothetical protein